MAEADSERCRARNQASKFMDSSAGPPRWTLMRMGAWTWWSPKTVDRPSCFKMFVDDRACEWAWKGRKTIRQASGQRYDSSLAPGLGLFERSAPGAGTCLRTVRN